jgi:hypothetical protein
MGTHTLSCQNGIWSGDRIHTLVENGNEMGYPHSECAPAQGIRTLFYMLCYVDEVVNTQYRKGRERERGGPKGKKSCRQQASNFIFLKKKFEKN